LGFGTMLGVARKGRWLTPIKEGVRVGDEMLRVVRCQRRTTRSVSE
jgi:hypothetical protein